MGMDNAAWADTYVTAQHILGHYKSRGLLPVPHLFTSGSDVYKVLFEVRPAMNGPHTYNGTEVIHHVNASVSAGQRARAPIPVATPNHNHNASRRLLRHHVSWGHGRDLLNWDGVQYNFSGRPGGCNGSVGGDAGKTLLTLGFILGGGDIASTHVPGLNKQA